MHRTWSGGHTEAGETCEIPGIGPVPVATARALLGDAVVKLLLTRGVDVVTVVHLGRTVSAHQRSALEQRDPTCVVEGRPVRRHLEIDHVDGTAWRAARAPGGGAHRRQQTRRGRARPKGAGRRRRCSPSDAVGLADRLAATPSGRVGVA